MNGDKLHINGGSEVVLTRQTKKRLSMPYTIVLAMILILSLTSSSFAQGSIFGTVNNSDLSVPANGAISFIGYLDDTDEEIRLESSTGAGYDNGNWFDDFQNYLTEAAGNPYTYRFANLTNGEAFTLNGLIPSSSFDQQNVVLVPSGLPITPTGINTQTVSSSTIVVSWISFPGLTYHVYRRAGTSNGSFFRMDNVAGLLSDPGVAVNYFVDNTVDGISSYGYVVIAEDAGGQFSPHSLVVVGNSATILSPQVTSVSPDNGSAVGGTSVTIFGSGFDIAGVNATIGSFSLTSISAVSPFEITGITQAGPIGIADVNVTNLSSTLTTTLTGGYTYNANSAPILDSIGPKSVLEAQTLSFVTSATDPEGGSAVMTTGPLPGTATYIDNGDGTGSFNWATTFTDAGTYDVTFFAIDNVESILIDSEVVTITVQEIGNQAPVLAPISDTTVAESVNLSFVVTATDADGEIPSLSVGTIPLNAIFVDNGDGTSTFDFTPDFTQAGIYSITFKAVDGALAVDSAIVVITVTETNQLPVLAAIGSMIVGENVLLSFPVTATDGDGTFPVLSVANLPAGAIFVDSLNGAGSFIWTPLFTDAGDHIITFYAEDGAIPGVIDSEVVTISVTDAGNQPPQLAPINDTTIVEGTVLSLIISATDLDGTIAVLSAINIPINATFVDNADGTGLFTFSPDFLQDTIYTVTFFASDGFLIDSQIVNITVVDAGNVPPVITLIPDTSVAEGQELVITVFVTDPDGTTSFPLISASSNLSNFTFVDNRNGTGTLTYLPSFFDAGIDTVLIFAVDFGTPQQTTIETFIITTIEVNQPPSYFPVGPLGVIVGKSLTFTIFATDSTDQDTSSILILSALIKPQNSFFKDNGNSSGIFTYAPSLTQVGVDTVVFLVVDQGVPQLSSTIEVIIQVVTENLPPVLDPIAPQQLLEGSTVNLLITGSDPDGPDPVLEAIDLPRNASFTVLGPGSGAFAFSPDFTQAGLFAVKFRAFDGIDVTDQIVLFQVDEAGDQAPVFDSIPNPTVIETNTLIIVITAFDPDTLDITLSLVASTVPPNMTFVDSGNGVGVITFIPDFSQSGNYFVDVVADDGTQTTTITIPIVVEEIGNQLPIMDPVADQTAIETVNLSFSVTASDIDGDIPILSMVPSSTNIPASAFTDLGTGTGQFSWTPTDQDAGSYTVKFFAEDGAFPGVFDSAEISIIVADTNRAPFVLAASLQTINEGSTLTFSVSAFDADGTTPFLDAYLDGTDSLATNMTFVDNRDGTGTITYLPAYDVVLARTGFVPLFIRFSAVDEADTTISVESSSNTQINVQATNQPPNMFFSSGIGPFSLIEGALIEFSVQAVDSDGVAQPIVIAENLPPNASFTVNGSLGQFLFSPDFTQAGSYSVTFIAIDEELGADTQVVQINVTEAGNQPPAFITVLPDTINIAAGAQSLILVQATDPDLDPIVLTVAPVDPALPNGFFVDSGNGSGVYLYIPEQTVVGLVTQITFTASDPSGSVDLITHFRVVSFLRGDIDGNNKYTMNDLVVLITYLFRSGPAPETIASADTDGDGKVNILDITYLINFLYYKGPAPPQ